MKKLFFILTVIISMTVADEPPSWNEFSIKSKNGLYVAKIKGSEKPSPNPWEWRYELKVYENNASQLLWSCPYRYDGFPYGLLTDDGKSFIYVDKNYGEDKSVVLVYQEGGLKYDIKGAKFQIPSHKLLSTASSLLWLGEQRYRVKNDTLLINTIDRQSFVIKLD